MTICPIRILVHPANIPHVQNYLEVMRGSAALGQQAEIRAVTLEKWYLLGALPTLQRHGIHAYDMPRPSGSRIVLWRTQGGAEAVEAYLLIEQHFEEILSSFRPHLFLICGDDGLFEAGFLRSCRRFRVPSILIAEMPMQPADTVSDSNSFGRSLLRHPLTGIRRAHSFLRHIQASGLKPQIHGLYSAIQRVKPAPCQHRFPQVRPFGLNGATAIAAAGLESAQRFVAHGVPRSRIVVTGWPRLDRLFRFVQEHMNTSADCNGSVSKPIKVSYADSGYALFGEDLVGYNLLEHVLGAARILGNRARIGVRLKPGERAEHYSDIWPRIGEALYVFDNTEDLYQQLARIDIVIGDNSAVQAEAMMMGLPIVNLMRSESDDWKEFVSSGAALPAFNGKDLADAILTIANNTEVRNQLLEARKRYLFRWFHHFDGCAGERVAKLALDLCQLKTVAQKPLKLCTTIV